MATAKGPSAKQRADAQRQATRIIRRLMAHFMADGFAPIPDPEPGQPRKKQPLLTDSQVKTGLGLLKKFMPDLKSIEVSGDPNHPLVQEIRRVIVDSPHANDSPRIPPAADPE